ncbi:hypothetical protein [Hydrogenophaga sp. 2FB]|uniref:hypothetical protein n=1 Tax=Hydrogenophaga sp. 2FB TaxID=2502187 RepID=UPI001BB1A8DE|nr:hypothetical protein [Hydrogenophaga sp. 2FB]
MNSLHHFWGLYVVVMEQLDLLHAFALLKLQTWTFSDTLQWAGAVTGLAGAYLLALNASISKWGWFGFLGANLFIGSYAYVTGANGLLVQQIGFTGTSILGIWRSNFSWTMSMKRALEARRSKEFRGMGNASRPHVSKIELL